MTIVTTNNEAEALLLEAQLIKRYRPAYNVLLRDDKSFPFILLRADHDFPRIQKHRGARRAKGNYYGPFASAGSGQQHAQRAAEAVPAALLHRRLLQDARPAVPALSDQALLGALRRPHRHRRICRAYRGREERSSRASRRRCRPSSVPRCRQAAQAMDFERAAVLRDRLKALTFIQGTQAINAEGVGDADIFAMACHEGVIGIQAFFIRGGQNWGHRSFFPAHTVDVPQDGGAHPVPDAILRGSAARASGAARPRATRGRSCWRRRYAGRRAIA